MGLALLGGTLLLPVLVCRRRRIAGPGGEGSRCSLAALAGRLGRALPGRVRRAEVLALTGATQCTPPAPIAPCYAARRPAIGVLGGVAAAMLLAFLLARFLAGRPDRTLVCGG